MTKEPDKKILGALSLDGREPIRQSIGGGSAQSAPGETSHGSHSACT